MKALVFLLLLTSSSMTFGMDLLLESKNIIHAKSELGEHIKADCVQTQLSNRGHSEDINRDAAPKIEVREEGLSK